MTGVPAPDRATEDPADTRATGDTGAAPADDAGVDAGSGTSRGRVALVLVRGTAIATLVLVAYYTTPFRIVLDLGTLIRLVAALVAVGVLLAWQVRAIARSTHPVLRAVETLTVALPLFLLVFAATYTVMSEAQPASFSEELSRTDSIYFVVTVFATVGFGDIAPVSAAARMVVTVQMIADLLLLGLVLRALLNAVERGRARQRGGRPPADGGAGAGRS
jgi:voltage-gated potassium channel